MLVYIFVGSLLPYIEVLDSWLYEGTLCDTHKEVSYICCVCTACVRCVTLHIVVAKVTCSSPS